MPSVVSVEKTVGGGGRGRAPLSNLSNRSFPTSIVQEPCHNSAQKPRSPVRTSPGDFEDHAAAAIVLASLAGAAPSDPAPSAPPSAPSLLPIVNQQGGDAAAANPVGITADAVAALQQIGGDVRAANSVGITADAAKASEQLGEDSAAAEASNYAVALQQLGEDIAANDPVGIPAGAVAVQQMGGGRRGQ